MIPRIEAMLEILEQHSDDPGLTANLDLSEYRRHKAELLTLQSELQETLQRLLTINTDIESRYASIFQHWRNDVIKLNTYRTLLTDSSHTATENITVSRSL